MMDHNYIQGARTLLDHSEDTNSYDNAIMYAQKATACALIAIAEELRAINEREAMKIEWEAELPIDRTPEQIAHRAMEELDRINDELPY
jgi:hypothetical protein